jgi:hypothetical protein
MTGPGIYVCDEESQKIGRRIDCEAECCKQGVYDCLPFVDYGSYLDYECGGRQSSPPGTCWQILAMNDPEKVRRAFGLENCTFTDLVLLLTIAIPEMCTRLNQTGCLERCDRIGLCLWFEGFCDCLIDWSNPPFKLECGTPGDSGFGAVRCFGVGKAPTVYIKPGSMANENTLFHELVHVYTCRHQGIMSDKQAYGCESICFGDKPYVQPRTIEEVCCCRDSIVFGCEGLY